MRFQDRASVYPVVQILPPSTCREAAEVGEYCSGEGWKGCASADQIIDCRGDFSLFCRYLEIYKHIRRSSWIDIFALASRVEYIHHADQVFLRAAESHHIAGKMYFPPSNAAAISFTGTTYFFRLDISSSISVATMLPNTTLPSPFR
jgi:hypothetical protein